MYGEIFALLIAVVIILITLIKSQATQVDTHYCKKSEILNLLDDISDDTVVQILIGRNTDEHKRAGNHRR